MKILRPGKVEQRKFVCPDCGCVFAQSKQELCELSYGFHVTCPEKECNYEFTDDGEPYEEPTPTQTDRERLEKLLMNGDVAENLAQCVNRLIRNGVTFREG